MNETKESKNFYILYVDDEEMALKYFSQAFSKNFDVITSNSAESAREILKEKSDEIAVLLTDQRMPNEMGVKLLEYARTEYPHIIRLLTTAYTDIKDAIDAVNNGEIYRYITKPWDIVELNKQLSNAIHLYLAKQHEQDLLNEKRRSMFQLAGNIAHELRTPLLTIKSSATGATNLFSRLIEIYEQAKKADPSIPEIRTSNLRKMETVFGDIISESKHSLMIIDMLMVNAANEHNNPNAFSAYSMVGCINGVLERFPFKNDQDKIVAFSDKVDFISYGAPILMTHVFFNLLKNALYAIAANGDEGAISIRLEPGKENNLIYFCDTSTGIASDILPYIFEDFYSTKSTGVGHNIGLGLPFCKNTLQAFGGSIQCQSEMGVQTEFIIKLPVISEI